MPGDSLLRWILGKRERGSESLEREQKRNKLKRENALLKTKVAELRKERKGGLREGKQRKILHSYMRGTAALEKVAQKGKGKKINAGRTNAWAISQT